MTDLASWLTAQLDHDEAHAQKDLWTLDRASQGRWVAHYGYNLPYSLLKVDGVETVRLTATRGPLADGEEDIHAADALLVARLVNKGRARAEAVLRTVAAHRAILHRHYPIFRDIGWNETDADGPDVVYAEIKVCGSCVPKHSHFQTRADVPEYPCADVRDLLSIYTDREGFDPSWTTEDR